METRLQDVEAELAELGMLDQDLKDSRVETRVSTSLKTDQDDDDESDGLGRDCHSRAQRSKIIRDAVAPRHRKDGSDSDLDI